MIRRPPRATRTDTLFPYTTLFRSTAVRARLRASYAIDDHFTIGTQIATGDPDDPNSTDVTLGSFVDDFAVSLDQAWVRFRNGGLTAHAGKFPQPFQRTDMLWDGDVSPQGAALAYTADLGGAKVDARGIYFVIDEAAVARDSEDRKSTRLNS